MSKLLKRLLHHESVRESGLIAGVQIFVILIGLANSAVLARLLGADQFGQFQFLITWVAVASAAGLPGMGPAILKSTLKDYDRFYWRATQRSLIVANIVAIFLFVIGGIGYWGKSEWKDIALIMLLISAGVPVTGLLNYESVLLGKRAFKTSRILQLFASSMMLVSTCIVAWIYDSGAYAYIAFVIVRLIIAIYALTIIKKIISTCPPNADFEDELLAQGWRQTALSFFILAASRLDRVLLGSISPALLAQYHVGTLIPLSIKNNSKLFLGVLASRWGKMDAAANKAVLKRNTFKLFVLGCLGFALTASLLPLIIPVIYGNEYNVAIWVGIISSISLIPAYWNQMRGLEDQIQGDGKSNQVAQVIRYIVLTLAVLVLAPHGIYWIAVAPLIADLAFTVASFWRPVQPTVAKS